MPFDLDATAFVKEGNVCYLALDFDSEMKQANEAASFQRTYAMPNGREITLGTEIMKCPELLF